MATFIIRDVRLSGWKPMGDVLEVDQNTPLTWLIDNIKDRSAKAGGDLTVIFMSHGLPGFLQCAKGSFTHPTAGNGITVQDLTTLGKIRGLVKRVEMYACLVARIGTCPECGGQAGYDGNLFCFRLAQAIQAEVKASIHIQYYYDGTTGRWIFRRPNGKGIEFGHWNGKVFTWGPGGNIIKEEDFPYEE